MKTQRGGPHETFPLSAIQHSANRGNRVNDNGFRNFVAFATMDEVGEDVTSAVVRFRGIATEANHYSTGDFTTDSDGIKKHRERTMLAPGEGCCRG